jgi:hypothetical protein
MKLVGRHTLLLATSIAVGCGGGDPVTNQPGLVDGTLTASVDGSSFSGDVRVTTSHVGQAVDIFAIQGTATGSKAIRIMLTGVSGTGTFSVTIAGASASYYEISSSTGLSDSWLANIVQGSGSVIISQLSSTHITGTFLFTAAALSGNASGTKTVTGGAFSIDLFIPM